MITEVTLGNDFSYAWTESTLWCTYINVCYFAGVLLYFSLFVGCKLLSWGRYTRYVEIHGIGTDETLLCLICEIFWKFMIFSIIYIKSLCHKIYQWFTPLIYMYTTVGQIFNLKFELQIRRQNKANF